MWIVIKRIELNTLFVPIYGLLIVGKLIVYTAQSIVRMFIFAIGLNWLFIHAYSLVVFILIVICISQPIVWSCIVRTLLNQGMQFYYSLFNISRTQSYYQSSKYVVWVDIQRLLGPIHCLIILIKFETVYIGYLLIRLIPRRVYQNYLFV